jgi:hypothetical protein
MPSIIKQKPGLIMQAAQNMPQSLDLMNLGGVLGTALDITRLKPYQKVCIYGRNRLGKSTLAAQWPKPMLVLACEPAEYGGIASIRNIPGITPLWISLQPQTDPRTGRPEEVYGTAKLEAAVAQLLQIQQQTGVCPFKSIVVDTVTALQDIVMAEIMGWNNLAIRLNYGVATKQTYGQRSERTRELMRKIKDVKAHVVFVAQEKDHNVPKGDDVKRSANFEVQRDSSFFGAALGDAAAGWLHDTCDYVGRLYQEAETKVIVSESKVGGDTVKEEIVLPTGRMVRRFRTMYAPNYAGGFRSPRPENVPEWIEAETPQEMYQEIVKVIGGERTTKGYYPTKR